MSRDAEGKSMTQRVNDGKSGLGNKWIKKLLVSSGDETIILEEANDFSHWGKSNTLDIKDSLCPISKPLFKNQQFKM